MTLFTPRIPLDATVGTVGGVPVTCRHVRDPARALGLVTAAGDILYSVSLAYRDERGAWPTLRGYLD